MNKKIGKIFIFIAGIIVSIFIIGVNLSFAISNIIDSKTLIKPAEINNENIDKKLLEVANIKLEIANEKEAAYDKAINQLKLYVTFFGSFLIIVAIAFGIYKNNKIVEAKDELLKSIEEKKKSLEEANSLYMEKKIFELEKNNITKIEEIGKLHLSNVEDLQVRVKKLENPDKIDLEDKNIEKSNKEDVSFKDKNPYE